MNETKKKITTIGFVIKKEDKKQEKKEDKKQEKKEDKKQEKKEDKK